ncbi:hypothetical protein BZA05DRAFT_402215 [Tricharina praecox]|uniref:uncharacterized protein n=1 Tax=Tricharina praecox TaxID=43433 RepID=UPI00221FA18B|nr:uncharacterized protein BZA05DRAFT_402215 [Tricharina praecox]KAI5849102.1 hypothetical protein BZA05DRAFT_402215 [Tricharina praecox]
MTPRIFPPIPIPSSTDADLLPSDIICFGSDDECDEGARDRRIVMIAENYLRGYGVYMHSAVNVAPKKMEKQEDPRIVDYFAKAKVGTGKSAEKRVGTTTTTTMATTTATTMATTTTEPSSSSGSPNSSGPSSDSLPLPRNLQPDPAPTQQLPIPVNITVDIRIASSPPPSSQPRRKRKLEVEIGNGQEKEETEKETKKYTPMIIDWKKKRPKIDFAALSPVVAKRRRKESDKNKDSGAAGRRSRSRRVTASGEREMQTEAGEKVKGKAGAKRKETPIEETKGKASAKRKQTPMDETIHVAMNAGEAGPSGSADKEKRRGSRGVSGGVNSPDRSAQATEEKETTVEKAAVGKPAEPEEEKALQASARNAEGVDNGGEKMRTGSGIGISTPARKSTSPSVEDTIQVASVSRKSSPSKPVTTNSPSKSPEPATSTNPHVTLTHPVQPTPHRTSSETRETEEICSQVISNYIQHMAAPPETPYTWQSTQAQLLAAQDGFFNAMADSPIRFDYTTPEGRKKSQLNNSATPDLSWGILPSTMAHPPLQVAPSTIGKPPPSTSPWTASKPPPPAPAPKTPGDFLQDTPVIRPPPLPATPLSNGFTLSAPSTSELTPFGAFATPASLPSSASQSRCGQPAQPLLSLSFENSPENINSPSPSGLSGPSSPSPDDSVHEMMGIMGSGVWDIDEELRKMAGSSTPTSTTGNKKRRPRQRQKVSGK